MTNRNVALDRDGDVWAQGTFTDLWRCVAADDQRKLQYTTAYNDLVTAYGPIETLHPATEKYRTVR